MSKRIETKMLYVKSMKPEYHEDELEIILVLKGTVKLCKIEREIELKEGEFAFINRYISHYLQSDGAYILSCKIKLSEFKHIFKRIEYVEFLSINEINEYKRPLRERLNSILIDLLVKEYQLKKRKEKDEFIDDQLVGMLFASYQLINNIKDDNDYINEELQDRYYFIVEYVFNHIDQKIVSEDIIKLLYMNSTYFSQFMKKIGGVGFKEFVLYRKLVFITAYLLEPSYSMDKIASKVGITDMKSFYNIFKRYYKVSPSKWKNRIFDINDNYTLIDDNDVLNTFISEYKVSKHKDNTISKLYKYMIVSLREKKNFNQTEFVLNPYLDMGDNIDNDYQVYKYFDSLYKLLKQNNLKLCLMYPYKYVKDGAHYNLTLEFLKLSIIKSGINEVKKWKIVIVVRNILDLEEANKIKREMIKELEINNIYVQLDALSL